MDDQEGIDEILVDARRRIFAAHETLENALREFTAARLRSAANVAKMERAQSILAGRTTPPTAAEVAAHYAAGGKWRVVEHECEREPSGRPFKRAAAERTLSEPDHISAYKWEVEDWRLPTTWWALDKGYLLTTWPQVEAPPVAAEPKVIGEARIEALGIPGVIHAGMPEEIVGADAEWLLARSGVRYSRRDGIDVKAQDRITPIDLAKINAAVGAEPAPRGPFATAADLDAIEKGTRKP